MTLEMTLFSRTENRILGALARVDDFLMNPLLQGHSGASPEASRDALSTSEGTNEDDSENDPHPEAGLLHSQITQNSCPEKGHDMVTGVQKESVTWVSNVINKPRTAKLAPPVKLKILKVKHFNPEKTSRFLEIIFFRKPNMCRGKLFATTLSKIIGF